MRIWLSRFLIGIVIFFNVQCALFFIIRPDLFMGGFELQGEVGEAMIRGLGSLFLMWNVPYAVALWNPVRFHTSLYEAIAMQSIGVVGESILLALLTGEHPAVRSSILRFIYFDTAGLIALVTASLIIRSKKP